MRRRMLMNRKNGILPEGYTMKKYCTPAASHSYIISPWDTLVCPKKLPRVVMSVYTDNKNITGVFGNEQFAVLCRWGDFKSKYRYGSTVRGYAGGGPYANTDVIIDASNKLYVIKDGVKSLRDEIDDVYNGEGIKNILLFAGFSNGTDCVNTDRFYIGETEIYEDNTLLAHFFPCSDPQEQGTFYDIVNKREIDFDKQKYPLKAVDEVII